MKACTVPHVEILGRPEVGEFDSVLGDSLPYDRLGMMYKIVQVGLVPRRSVVIAALSRWL